MDDTCCSVSSGVCGPGVEQLGVRYLPDSLDVLQIMITGMGFPRSLFALALGWA